MTWVFATWGALTGRQGHPTAQTCSWRTTAGHGCTARPSRDCVSGCGWSRSLVCWPRTGQRRPQPAALRCSITKKTRSYPSEGMWRPILLLHVLTLTTIWPSHVACPAAAPWGLHHKFEPRGRATMRPPVGMALSVRCGKCASLKKGTVSYTCSQPGCPPCRYC